MELVKSEKKMSTKELADVIGVESRTVQRTAEKLATVLSPLSKNSQGGYLFTEEQATLVKQEIQKHHNLKSRQIDSVSTELEENEMILNAMTILQKRKNELELKLNQEHQARLVAEKSLTTLTDAKGLFTMNTAAKALKLPYGNKTLFNVLRAAGVLNNDNTPRQEQVNAGHFKVVIKEINQQIGNKAVTLVTSKGLVYLSKKLNAEIDQSVMPDSI